MFGASVALADTNVAGSINSNTTWSAANSPYTVTGDVIVGSGAVLTIEPGVTVYMSGGTNLTISAGGLQAAGTNALPIKITSFRDVTNPTPAPAPGDWGQIRFLSGTVAANTQLSNVVVKYGSGLVLTAASPTLNSVGVLNHSGPAISIDLASSPVGTGLTASGNGLNGILVPPGEVLGDVTWALRGIPYVVAQGTVSVGPAPSITSLSPNFVSQGSSIDATITGVQLGGVASASASDAHTAVTLLPGATSTFVPVRIAVGTNATAGTATLTLQVAGGTAAVPFTIAAAPLNLGVVPNPIAVPPDNNPRNFLITLSRTDTVATAVSVAVDNTNVASVSPASGSIPAGQTQVTFQLTGKTAGQTTLRVTSPSLTGVNVPVYVTTDYAGVNTTYSTLVGVQVGASGPAGNTYSGLASSLVGVQVGTSATSGTTYSGLASQVLGVQVGTSGATSTTYTGLVSPLVGVQVGTNGTTSTTYNDLASQPLGVQVGASGSTSTTYSGLVAPLLGVQVGAFSAASTTYSGLVSPIVGVQVGTPVLASAPASRLASSLISVIVTSPPNVSSTLGVQQRGENHAPSAFAAAYFCRATEMNDALSQPARRSAAVGDSICSMDSVAASFAVY